MSNDERVVIRTQGLTKTFGDLVAVRDLNLTIRQGEVYGLLGPNGAGKTTTIHMLLGLLAPTDGLIEFFGESFALLDQSVRRFIGVVPEKHPVLPWKWITGFEYLSFFAELFGVESRDQRISLLVHRVSLDDAINRPVLTYSRGMLQRLSIARALVPSPQLLVLDEPISGIDPHGVKEIRDLVLEQKENGTTILVSSHLLSEVEKICDRIGIMDEGILVREADKESLLSEISGRNTYEITVGDDVSGVPDLFSDVGFVDSVVERGRGVFEIETCDNVDRRAEISDVVVNNGIRLLGMREIRSSLEEAYVAITRSTVRSIATDEKQSHAVEENA